MSPVVSDEMRGVIRHVCIDVHCSSMEILCFSVFFFFHVHSSGSLKKQNCQNPLKNFRSVFLPTALPYVVNSNVTWPEEEVVLGPGRGWR